MTKENQPTLVKSCAMSALHDAQKEENCEDGGGRMTRFEGYNEDFSVDELIMLINFHPEWPTRDVEKVLFV
jgi:hypothetical protein